MIFEAGNETREKFGLKLALNKSAERSEKSGFVHTAGFERARN